jgi:hypothetical protein
LHLTLAIINLHKLCLILIALRLLGYLYRKDFSGIAKQSQYTYLTYVGLSATIIGKGG